MKTSKLFPRQMNDAIFYVTHYDAGMVTGVLSHPRSETPLPICSIPQLLFTLGDLLSREDMPLCKPGFQKEGLPENPIAMLRLQILFQEHHTWQGYIIWEEQQAEASFRSVLELIELLDEILAE